MKKLITLFLLSIVAFGCKETNLDEYYVRYEVTTSTIYRNPEIIEVTINDESGNQQTYAPDKSFDIFIGPVNKGFNALLIATPVSTATPADIFLTISVYKNVGPFAQKATNSGTQNSGPIELSYTVE